MFLAPLIISGFFVLLIIFFPFIIKCIFKFSSCVGYCIGFCCSVLTMLIIVVCSIGILCAIFIPLKDDIDSKKINSENILQHVTTLYISIVIGIIIIIFLSVFFIMLFFTKKVSTPNYTYSSIFMFISGYTLAFIFAFTAQFLCSYLDIHLLLFSLLQQLDFIVHLKKILIKIELKLKLNSG